ncbi:lipid-A-disaccharide synthase [Rhodospirillaceae bacterium]|nr:lipid-A-disaccharide synthase [Rhodospirillaceae bacterium]
MSLVENDQDSSPLFYIIAGEVSGDMIGAGVMKSLKKLTSGKVRFAGVGGVRMSSEGLESLFPLEELSIVGIFELVPKVPKLLKRIRETVRDVLIKNPCAVITIDSKGFTFRVAEQIAIKQNEKNKKIKLIHIVAPTVWAYRPGRAKKTAKIFDHLLTLFPFEAAYFIPHGLKTSFVGHPALEEKEGAADKFKKSFSIPEDCLVLSLLPGSRTSEVNKLLPIFEETILKLKQHYPKLFILMPTVPALEGYIRNIVSDWAVENVILVQNQNKQNAFAASDFAIAASGTATLELALARVPTIVTYKLNLFTGWLAYFLVNHQSIVIANRILERPLFPLLVQASCNSNKIVEVLLSQKDKKTISEEMELASSTIRERLSIGRNTSSDLAAQVILNETRVL